MKLPVVFAKVQYLPLRAVPCVTSNVLDLPTLAQMITEPDAFCDKRYDEVIAPVRISLSGDITRTDYRAFSGFASAQPSAAAPALFGGEHLPPGMLVRLDAVREKYGLIMDHVVPKHGLGRITPGGGFVLQPTLTNVERDLVMEGIPPQRTNSAAWLRAEIVRAYDEIRVHCLRGGLVLDRDALPGTWKHWIRLVEHRVPTVAKISPATFKEHFKATGLRWRQGTPKEQLAAFEMATKTLPP